MTARLVVSPRARDRVRAAEEFVRDLEPGVPFLVVGQRRHAANRLCHRVAESRGALLGAWRFGFATLARVLAARALSEAALRPVTPAARRATVVRVVHRAREARMLGRFAAVAEGPGLVTRLALTFDELRLAGITPRTLGQQDRTLASLFGSYEDALAKAGFADQAEIFRAAGKYLETAAGVPPAGLPTVFLDVWLANESARRFGRDLTGAAPEVLWTLPEGDRPTEEAVRTFGAREFAPLATGAETRRESAAEHSALVSAQRHLFGTRRPERTPDRDSLVVLGAPGAAAEALECARFFLIEATAGTPFDRMALLLPEPQLQAAAVREAFERAGIPVFFEVGARTPHPAGRAFLLLLDCALEDLSATRFAEYLSLGETPTAPATGPGNGRKGEEGARSAFVAPRRWERLLFDSEVIGGFERWERRLSLFAHQLAAREEAAPEGSARRRIHRQRQDMEGLRSTALPLIRKLARLPATADWGSWGKRLKELAGAALVHPHGVLDCLKETDPMREVRDVSLEEVREGLAERLSEVVVRSGGSRYGSVWVSGVEAARGLSFEVVAVPGLAERAFPRVIREDPMLLDRRRSRLPGRLPLRKDLSEREQLRLRIAVGAPSRRLLLSYSSLEPVEARQQVPSYYLAEAFRAGFGRTPSLAAIRRAAGEQSRVSPGTRAPRHTRYAVDRREYALSRIVAALGREKPGSAAVGGASWLVSDPFLARALRREYLRASRRWTAADGFLKPGPEVIRLLENHRPGARSYSATGLQAYAECPYQFYLRNLVGLHPIEVPQAVEVLDPLSRGSLLHEVYFHLGERLRAAGLMPLPAARRDEAFEVAREAFGFVERQFRDRLAPAYDRLWRDQMDGLLGDLGGLLDHLVQSRVSIRRNEFVFGMRARNPADPESRSEPAILPGGLRLKGAIDAVERLPDGRIQITDYKTGKAPRETPSEGAVTLGGRTLQPLLYAFAWEAVSHESVAQSRLFFSTVRGIYRETLVNTGVPPAREVLEEFVHLLDEAISRGHFPALPDPNAPYAPCDYCEFRPVCGPAPARHRWTKPGGGRGLREIAAVRGLP